MNRTFRRQALVPVAALFIFTGCAKQPMLAGNAPLEGALPSPSLTQAAPAHSPVGGDQQKQLPSTPVSTATPATAQTPQAPHETGKAASAATPQSALQKIYFDFDSADLSPSARQSLADNYQLLQKNPASTVRIEGNCDERGSDEYNLALGERRAKAAARYLSTLGITPERLSTISYGTERPAVSGHDETAWAKNRRDEFVIVGR